MRDAVLNRSSKDRTPVQAAILKKFPKLNVGIGTLAQVYRERYQRELRKYNELVAPVF